MTRDRSGVHLRARTRVLGGYGPLAIGAALAVAMVLVVPSRIPDEIASAGDIDAREVPDGQTASGWGAGVAPCADGRQRQVDTAYAPPCFEFAGDNGGGPPPGAPPPPNNPPPPPTPGTPKGC